MRELVIETKSARYPVLISEGIISKLSNYIGEKITKVLIVTDQQVAKYHLETVKKNLAVSQIPHGVVILPPGEGAKSWNWLEQIITSAIEGGLDRRSLIISLGGGVVGDVSGFAAAIYMRGIPYLQIPTTVLAHDSSIGGKVGINHPLGKNMVGAFYHPLAVLYDPTTLLTLGEREYCSGFAEMVKHALLGDAEFFVWLEEHQEELLRRDVTILEEALYRSMGIKALIVKEDEREAGRRAILNLGHTIGHALEHLFQYRLLHGEAVALGLVAASHLATQYYHYDLDLPRINSLLKGFRLPLMIPEKLNEEEFIRMIKRDKKTINSDLVMVIPKRIGKATIQRSVPIERVLHVTKCLGKGSR